MIPTDRRSILRVLTLAALAPIGAIAIPAARASAAGRLLVPAGPMRLRRTITRGLGDSAMLSVTRTWECRFQRTMTGIRVEGRQIGVAVDAPPSLAALAEIERKRDVTDLFPAELDADGRFIQADGSLQNTDLNDAIDVAVAIVRDSALEAGARIEARQFLARLGKTAANLISTVQADLFYPVEGTNNLERELQLAGGINGIIEVQWSARAQSSGLLECTEKRIVTRVEGSARLARECWELTDA